MEDLVVGTRENTRCFAAPLTARFGGVSITAPRSRSTNRSKPAGNAAVYCWSRSQYDGGHNLNYGCLPKGGSTVAPSLPGGTEDVVIRATRRVKSCISICKWNIYIYINIYSI